MAFYLYIWTARNRRKLAEHGLTPDDFKHVVERGQPATSRSSGRSASMGYTRDGRLVFAVYEQVNEVTLLPVTAYKIVEE